MYIPHMKTVSSILIAMVVMAWLGFHGDVKALQNVMVNFTAIPQPMQVYPRSLSNNRAVVPISGEVVSPGQDEMVVRVYRDGLLTDMLTQTLTYDSGVATFSFSPEITAEMKNYTFEVHAKVGIAETLIESVTDVVAGDIYLINGQSNALAADGSGLNPAGPLLNPFIRSFGWRDTIENEALILADTNWYMAEGTKSAGTGEIGLWGLHMARRLLDLYGIPVAIINGAQGGKPIQFFQRDEIDPYSTQTNYGILYWRAQQAGVLNGLRAIFWYQGESPGGFSGEPPTDTAARYQSEFHKLYTGWQTDYPSIERIFVHQVRNGCGLPPVELRDLQRRFADIYADVDVMSTNGATHASDECHYRYENGYETIGEQIYPLVARELYGAPNTSGVDAPNIYYAYFSNAANSEITLVMRDPDDVLVWDTGAENYLLLETSAISVTDGIVDGNSLVLTLTGSASGATGITYDSPPGDGDWVRNEQGIGMLDFYNIAIDEAPPSITRLYLPMLTR